MSTEYEHITEIFASQPFITDFIPQELQEYPRWVLWSLCKTNRAKPEDKPTKRPARLSKNAIHGIDVARWSTTDRQYTYDYCIELYAKHADKFNGLGYIPHPDDDIIVVDYDNCFPLKDDDPRKQFLNWAVDNTFVEYSQSGNGAHIFIRGKLENRHNDSAGSGVEMYPGKKQSFIAMTGIRYMDAPAIIADAQDIIDAHIKTFFNKHKHKHSNSNGSYEIPDHIPNGNRNVEMTKLCGYLMSILTDIKDVYTQMIDYNQSLCETPLELAEIQTIVDSIYKRHTSKFAYLVENVYHVRASNTWFDFSDMTELSADSLNVSNLKEFSGKKNEKPKLSTWLPKQQGFNQVSDYTWLPVPYEHENRIVIYENRRLLNRWRGFAIIPKQGNVQPWLDHLAHLVVEDDYRRALLWWIAYTIQHPDKKINWQPIILGASGAGKDGLFRPIATILGSAFKSIGNKDIKGDYDDGLVGTKLLHISEAQGLRSNAVEFYKRITATESSDMQMLNPKSMAKIWQRNVYSVLVITNNLDAMKFTADERRAFVLRAFTVMNEQMKKAYFDDWLDKDGAAHLFYYLLNYDLSEFTPGLRPFKTKYFDELFDITRTDDEVNIEALLESYDIALPELIRSAIKMDSNYTNTKILVWLQEHGWARWDEGQESRRIKRSINGKQCTPKNRSWYVRKSSRFYQSSPAEMCLEVERVEAEFIKKSKF